MNSVVVGMRFLTASSSFALSFFYSTVAFNCFYFDGVFDSLHASLCTVLKNRRNRSFFMTRTKIYINGVFATAKKNRKERKRKNSRNTEYYLMLLRQKKVCKHRNKCFIKTKIKVGDHGWSLDFFFFFHFATLRFIHKLILFF